MAIDVGGAVTRAHGINFDTRFPQLVGKLNRHAIQSRFGGVVAESDELGDRRLGIARHAERSQAARDIYDAPAFGAAEKGQHRLGNGHGTEQVGLIYLSNLR